MDSDAVHALLQSLKQINHALEKITQRIEVLESDYKERFIRKSIYRWLLTFYPVIMVVLVIMVDTDHHKIAEISGDVRELINDTRDLSSGMYARVED